MDVQKRVREFILTNFYVTEPDRFADEASLFDQGVVDSTGVLEVIGFLEVEFGIRVADAEVIPENLESIARIAAFVTRKQLCVAS